jgi:SAM-dependent methyltransferase
MTATQPKVTVNTQSVVSLADAMEALCVTRHALRSETATAALLVYLKATLPEKDHGMIFSILYRLSAACYDEIRPNRTRAGTVLEHFAAETGDACLNLFCEMLREWQMPIQGKVLEIGCCEADWINAALKADPSLEITGVDWRERASDKRWTFVRGDVNAIDFPENSFDWVIAISSIEHIGLGHYDSDPVREDGDTECMKRVLRWLKPGGSIYFDVPHAKTYHVVGTKHREYTLGALQGRLWLPGFTVLRQSQALMPTTNGTTLDCLANWWTKEA